MIKKNASKFSNGTSFHIITLFPHAFDSYLRESIIARAVRNKKIKISLYNPRDFSRDKHRRVDRKPYGGGPGMVLEALPVLKAVQKARGRKRNVKIIFLSPGGRQFDNSYAAVLSKKYKNLILIAGRYEGIDARVKKILRAEEISIGPYTLTGGELPAMVIIDSVSRHLKGVLGKEGSLEERRIASSEVYTRPEILAYKGKRYQVPKVLLSGNHRAILSWRGKRR
jgi:tRNA (guanine37-N1)-methyltransferase